MSDGQQRPSGQARKEDGYPHNPAGGGPTNQDPDPAIPHNFTGHRGARHRPRPESEGPTEGQCQHIKSKTPCDEEKHVPEVGLELHSSPCKHWKLQKTYAILANPADVRPSPRPKVWTLSTLLFCQVLCQLLHPFRIAPLRRHGSFMPALCSWRWASPGA